MIEESSEGHIVNTSSMAGLAAAPGLGLYATSKHGVVTTHIAGAKRNRPARLQNPPEDASRHLPRSHIEDLIG